ncbi:MAG: DUF3810 domain-containing protein [Flavobacteriaceae bacterium]
MNFRKAILKQISILVLLLVGLALLRNMNFWVEFYGRNLYPHMAYASRIITSFIPFSIGDFIYLYIAYYFIKLFVRFFRSRFKAYLRFVYSFLRVLNYIIFLFYLMWGLNYYTPDLQHKYNLDKQSYTLEELESELTSQIVHINSLYQKIHAVDDSLIKFETDKEILERQLTESYLLTTTLLDIPYYRLPSVKPSLFSYPLAYMGFSGYLNPFTGEAQYNYKGPSSSRASTISHEIAHQLGIAPENDANFVGLVNCLLNVDPKVQFSGMLSLVSYTYSNLHAASPERAKKIIKRLNQGPLSELKHQQKTWRKYKNPLEPMFKKGYDAYLKGNAQEQGIQSYSQFMILWLDFNKRHQLY